MEAKTEFCKICNDHAFVNGPSCGRGDCPYGKETLTVRVRASEDPVNHPPHYTSHPSGIECIQVTEHFNFCRGNALKYLWRAGGKGGALGELEDLQKARWYLDREIARLQKEYKK